MNKDIIVVGSIAFDSIQTIKGKKNDLLGGSATYFSLASSLFTKTYLVGIVGYDFDEKYIKMFNSKNISTKYLQCKEGNTFRWGGIYDKNFENRDTLFTELGVFEDFNPTIDSTEFDSPILFLANIQPSLQMKIVNQVANASIVVLDTMNLWINNNYNKLIEVIQKTDILLINDEEILQLTNKSDIFLASQDLLSLGLKHIIIKQGSEGASIISKASHTPIFIPAVPNIDVHDPTGAGDSFAGGFLGYLAYQKDFDIINAVKYGTAVASYTVSSFGIDGIQNLELDNIKKRVKLIKNLMKGF